MLTGVHDRRGSSIAADIDAAIERVVGHFESSDLALRLDVLRALSAQAQLAFETTRARERLGHHPVSMDLIEGTTSQSTVYKTLAEKLTVDSCSCNYDVKRNVVMTTNVRWTLGSRKVTKKCKKSVAVVATKTEEKRSMITKYRYERVRQEKEKEEEEETLIKFTVVVAFGDDDATPKELLYFEMACEYPYPKSYYEEQHRLPSDDKEEEGDGKESKKEKKMEKKEQDKEKKEGEETKKSEEKCYQEQGDGETFGEELREFCFNNEVLADMSEWMGAGKTELDLIDVVGFFMAVPVHEDEWLVDERVCEILLQGGMGADSSDEESSEKDEENGDDKSEL
ncbi:unnamed protein product [Peronospora destructor]|uniref:Uncharacterized protein n=1 Tax=Peronospora destructor TaxID=86335 RepID=A0AAV0VER4_9STRA|nr:unnamed protein product [Peronospora destructor]